MQQPPDPYGWPAQPLPAPPPKKKRRLSLFSKFVIGATIFFTVFGIITTVHQHDLDEKLSLAVTSSAYGHTIKIELDNGGRIYIHETLDAASATVYRSHIEDDCYNEQAAFWTNESPPLVDVSFDGPLTFPDGSEAIEILGSCTLDQADAQTVDWSSDNAFQVWQKTDNDLIPALQ